MLPIVATAVLVLVVVGAGLLWRSRVRARILADDVLKRFFQVRGQEREVTLEGLAGGLGVPLVRVRRCLDALIERGLVRVEGASLHLTAAGREAASARVYRHRVLETYLAERAGRPLPQVHRLADRLEHRVPATRIEAMDRSLGHPVRDPHGDLIPGPRGRTGDVRRLPLGMCPPGSVVRVLHVEDEPDTLFQDLLTDGIVPATELEVQSNDDAGVTVTVAGLGARRLDTLAASMVDVVPGGFEAAQVRGMVRLSDLELGQAGQVVLLTNALRGDARRRLLDLGFTPGAEVRPVLENALGGDPTAYLIRSSRIALRRDQARHILVAPIGAASGASEEVAA